MKTMAKYDVALSACDSYEGSAVDRALREALDAIDGLSFVKPGMRIAVKVNLVTAMKPDSAAMFEKMLERIIPGKIKAIKKEVCLVDQKFVKNSDITVGQYVESVAKELGKDMKVVEMARFEVGEGIEKKEEDFAAEVAAQMEAANK